MKLSSIGKKAMGMTSRTLADELSSHTSWTADEIKTLFPTKADREELGKLIKAVSAASDENAKRTFIIKNVGSFAGAMLKVTRKSLGIPGATA